MSSNAANFLLTKRVLATTTTRRSFQVIGMCSSACGDPDNSVRGLIFFVIKLFHRGPYGPSLETLDPTGVQLLLEGVCTSISKET